MKYTEGMLSKTLVIGIILLFVVMSFTPSVAVDIVKKPTMANSNGKTLYVGGTGEGNYSNIQNAIDNSSNGDTVFVYNGTYYESIVINKSINLIGENKDNTVINSKVIGDVIYINVDWVNINGFTIKYSGDNSDLVGININSSHNSIINNIIINHYLGILLFSSSNNTIKDNYISNNSFGIYLFLYSNNNDIVGNSFFSDGLFVFQSYNNNVEDNTVNAKPLVYYQDETDKIIVDAGQVILVNCDNIKVENLNLSNTVVGIELWETHNCLMKNNNCSNNYHGIVSRASNNNNISGNTISSNYWRGINIEESRSNIIRGNNILNNSHGIFLSSCSNHTIRGNNVTFDNTYGIKLYRSRDNRISGNLLYNNFNGIHLYESKNNSIFSNNTISNNTFGIELYGGSNNNSIFHNNFIENVQNAFDECNNTWDNGYLSGGNYWDDYNGTDSDGDGIGDTPYPIAGGDNEDNYPLIEPWYSGNHPPNIPVIEGQRRFKVGDGGEYPYTIYSTDPDNDDISYIIDRGCGSIIEIGPYPSGQYITINVSIPLRKGTYIIFKIRSIDIFGAESNWATLKVTIPRNRISVNSLFQLFFDRYPLLERLLALIGLLFLYNTS